MPSLCTLRLPLLTLSVATLILVPIGFAQDSKPAAPAPTTAAKPAKDSTKAQAVLKRAMEKNAKKRDFAADIDMKVTLAAMGLEMKGTGKLSVSAQGKLRQDLKMDNPMGGGSMNILVINDGKTMWIQQDLGPMGKMVTKGTVEEFKTMQEKAGNGMPGAGGDGQDPTAQLESLAKTFDFDTCEDVEIDGKPYVALTGDMRKNDSAKKNAVADMMGSMMKRARLLLAKESDMFSGVEFLDAASKPVVAMHYKNMNMEPKFDEKLFSYEPPAGVKVMSIADAMRMAGSMMGDEDEESDEEEEAASRPASKPAGGK